MNVKCVETGKVYITTTCAAEAYGISQSGVAKCCHGIRNKAAGLHWEFTSDRVTEMRKCACGKMFLPTEGAMTFCSRDCRRKAYKYDVHKSAVMMTEFTFDTNLMIVQEYERRGNLERLSGATGRPMRALNMQLGILDVNGKVRAYTAAAEYPKHVTKP